MTNKTKTVAIKPLTAAMRGKGLAAFEAGAKADSTKDEFFKAIKSRVTLENVSDYKPEFTSIAIEHYAKLHNLGDRLVTELASPTLKNTAKLKGCPLTMKALKDGITIMAGRWIRAYKQFLNTGEIPKAGGKAGAKKRATKGAVVIGKADKKPVDTPELNQAPEMTPIKRAIEQVSSIPNMVLKETLPSQCEEDLRAEIQIAALQLVELLSKIK